MAQMQAAEPTQSNSNHALGLHGMTISEKGMQVHAPTPSSSSSSFEGKGGSITSEYGGGLTTSEYDGGGGLHDQGKTANRGVLPQQDVGIGYNLNPSPSLSLFSPSTFSTDTHGLGAPSSDASHPPPPPSMAMAMAMAMPNPNTLRSDDHHDDEPHHHHSPEISISTHGVPLGVQEKLREGLVIPLDAVEAPQEGCVHTTGDMYGHVVCVSSPPPPPPRGGDHDSVVDYAICNVSSDSDGNGEPCHEGVGERLMGHA